MQWPWYHGGFLPTVTSDVTVIKGTLRFVWKVEYWHLWANLFINTEEITLMNFKRIKPCIVFIYRSRALKSHSGLRAALAILCLLQYIEIEAYVLLPLEKKCWVSIRATALKCAATVMINFKCFVITKIGLSEQESSKHLKIQPFLSALLQDYKIKFPTSVCNPKRNMILYFVSFSRG